MTFYPYTVQNLAVSDAEGTDGKNIVAGAVITATDVNGNTAVIYDDSVGSGGATSKTTNDKGKKIIYLPAGEYSISVNGELSKVIISPSGLTDPGGAALVGESSGSNVQASIDALKANQITGVIVFATYAELDAYAPADADEQRALYRVTNDTTAANNGYYRWVSGTTYEQAADSVTAEGALTQADLIEHELAVKGATYKSANLLDTSDDEVSVGFFVNSTTGALSANAAYTASGYIYVEPSTQYYLSRKSFIAWYDAGKSFISGSSDADTNNVQTSPVGAAFLRISVNTSTGVLFEDQYVVQGGSMPSVVQPFGGIINNNRVFDLPSTSIAKNAVTFEKLSFSASSKNLFNKDTATIGSFLGDDGVAVVDATYFYSDFIEVTEGLTYHVESATQNARFLAAYNESKLVVEADGLNASFNSYTVPAGIKYIRFTGNVASFDTYQFELGELKSKYTDYANGLDGQFFIAPSTKPLLERSKNLFNRDTVTSGYYLSAAGSLVLNSSYSVSDYIEVEPSTTYFVSSDDKAMRFYTAFDENKEVVPSEGLDAEASTITVPSSGVKYYRISVFNSTLNTYQMEVGSSATYYERSGLYSNSEVLTKEYDREGWKGTLAASYGDSITAQNTWQRLVSRVLGLEHIPYGIGGRRVSGTSGMHLQTAIDAIALDRELILVMGGMNDWAGSVALGSIDSTDTEEFYGAYNEMIENLITTFPSARIVLMTVTHGEFATGNWESRPGFTDGETNAQGLKTYHYSEAVREMGKKWFLPVADMSKIGWNKFNADDYTTDDGNYIHPNPAGDERIAQAVIGELRNITKVQF